MTEVNGILAAAHELKAPLVVLRQLAYYLDSRDPAEMTATKKQLITISDRAIQQVNDLIKIARLEQAHTLHMEPVSVRAVCEDVTRQLEDLCTERHKTITVRYKNRLPLALANHDLLRGALYNFCANAINCSEDSAAASLSVHDHYDCIQIDIRDFGPALPTPIWREFCQGGIKEPAAVAMRPGSSSLGLYIASKFSQYLNAEIYATRHRDGTTFRLLLPAVYQTSLFEEPQPRFIRVPAFSKLSLRNSSLSNPAPNNPTKATL